MNTLNFDFLSTMGLLERLLAAIRNYVDCDAIVIDRLDCQLAVSLTFNTRNRLLIGREVVLQSGLCENVLEQTNG